MKELGKDVTFYKLPERQPWFSGWAKESAPLHKPASGPSISSEKLIPEQQYAGSNSRRLVCLDCL